MEKSPPMLMLKDVEEIYGRLFNHHPIISGEIKYFLKAFEEQRKDREVERLFQVFERTTEIREAQLDKIQNSSDALLCNISVDFEVALSMCDHILEKDKAETEDDSLKENRQARKIEWELFIQDMDKKRTLVDDSFCAKEDQLKSLIQRPGRKAAYPTPDSIISKHHINAS